MGNAGLIFSGMASGAGQAAFKSLNDLQHTFSEEELVKERARLDDLRLEKQNAFAASENEKTRALTREEGAAGRNVTQEEGAATRRMQVVITGMGIAAHRDIANEQNQLQRDLSNANILSHETLTRDQQKQADEHFKQTIGLQQEQLSVSKQQLATSATHALPLADGTVALYSTLGGKPKALGLLSGDDKGTPLHVGTDLTKREQGMMTALTNVLVHKIDENKSQAALMWTEDQRASNQREIDTLMTEIRVIGSGTKNPPQAPPPPMRVAPSAMVSDIKRTYPTASDEQIERSLNAKGFTLRGSEPPTTTATTPRPAVPGPTDEEYSQYLREKDMTPAERERSRAAAALNKRIPPGLLATGTKNLPPNVAPPGSREAYIQSGGSPYEWDIRHLAGQ